MGWDQNSPPPFSVKGVRHLTSLGNAWASPRIRTFPGAELSPAPPNIYLSDFELGSQVVAPCHWGVGFGHAEAWLPGVRSWGQPKADGRGNSESQHRIHCESGWLRWIGQEFFLGTATPSSPRLVYSSKVEVWGRIRCLDPRNATVGHPLIKHDTERRSLLSL